MGRVLRLFGLTSIAVVAVSAVAVASASAKEVQPKFVYKEGSKPTFTVTSGEGHMYVPKEHITITCTGDSGSGEITGEQTVGKLTATFTGCSATDTEKESEPKTCKVNSPGASSGEIVTKAITGKLGFIDEREREVGLLLTPESGETFTTLEFESKCTPVSGDTVTGSVIGVFSAASIGKSVTTAELKFVASASHEENTPTHFEEEGTRHGLDLFGLVKSSLASTEAITFSEAVEIKA